MGAAKSCCAVPSADLVSADEMERLLGEAEKWLKWDKNESDRAEIEALVKSKNGKELRARFGKRIAFGTAGLRGPMRAGFSSMNDLIIQQTTQGVYEYLKKMDTSLTGNGVVVGYDCRHNSKRFAQIAAAVFLLKGVKVYLFSDVCATPLVPFAVNDKKASAGIMVTASHNPKNDNGYKLYWSNGCQINSPHDKNISDNIMANLEPWDLNIDELLKSELNVDPRDECGERYLDVCTERLCKYMEDNKRSEMKITYTAMHGVGHEWCTRIFEKFGLPAYIPVEKQVQPDPEFTTVAFPNPEEGAGALKLSIETAEAHGSTLILANDPDADRLAVAEKNNGNWKVFNGNEIGTILASWTLFCESRFNPSFQKDKSAMVTTAVSSKMLETLCKKEGLIFRETHTGFKWIGNVADSLDKEEGIRCLFGYEEAIGFMIGDTSLDKDGVRAAAVFAEMANFLKTVKNQSCLDYLNSLYELYGYHAVQTNYFFCYDPDVMQTIFDDVRNGKEYLKQIGGHDVTRVRDLTIGYDSGTADNKPELPVTPGTHMITFWFNNGCVASIRGSGTEPKLKYYVEVRGQPGDKDFAKVDELHREMIRVIGEELLQPNKYGLTRPKH